MEKIEKALRDGSCDNCCFIGKPFEFEPCRSCIKSNSDIGFKFEPELQAELDSAKEALKKQIAKKPYKLETNKYYCSMCNKFVAHSMQSKTTWEYCPHCGQRFILQEV